MESYVYVSSYFTWPIIYAVSSLIGKLFSILAVRDYCKKKNKRAAKPYEKSKQMPDLGVVIEFNGAPTLPIHLLHSKLLLL